MSELSCAESAELSAELALGVADATDRVAVLAHVEHCAGCATSLRSMTDVADGLAALLPPVTPPAGFDARVLHAITTASGGRPGPARLERLARRPIVAAAAAVVAAAVLGLGGWLVGEKAAAPSTPVETAALVSHRTTVGQVVVVPGPDPWISMTVHLQAASAVVRCEVREADGVRRTLGTFTIVDGYGYWAAPLPYGAAVRDATLVTSKGHVLATATLPTR